MCAQQQQEGKVGHFSCLFATWIKKTLKQFRLVPSLQLKTKVEEGFSVPQKILDSRW